MNLFFLPFVRQGLTPIANAGARAQVSVAFRLESPGQPARDVAHTLPLLGPGDVVAIEPRQILRVSPAAGANAAEPDFFPLIEFDAPELPWAYSPTLPAGSRLPPWLALVVIEEDEALRLERGTQGQSPWILHLSADRARHELPDLADAATWAHAQVACDTSDQIAATLAARPDHSLSRLLAPRRLQPNRGYVAAVVPTYLSGRLAGLGEDPTGHPALVTGLEPAWSPLDTPTRLPAYHAWRFRTGEAGDFESLAQRLQAVTLDPKGEVTPLHLSLPSGNGALAVDWQAPLRAPGQGAQRESLPAVAVTEIRAALEGGTNPPILGPSYFGEPWTESRVVTPMASWAVALNLTPMLRAAAGLGADVVRAEQDDLVEAARAQFDAFTKAQREGRRRQLALAFVNRVAQRLATAPVTERRRVTAPLVARQRQASDRGAYTIAGRRIVRKTWKGVKGPGPAPESAGPSPAVIAPVRLAPLVTRQPVVVPPPPARSDAAAIPTGAFTPRFSRPMSEPLAERFPELMLPGPGSIPAEGVALVEANAAFVEAFLVGANQALNFELLWRGLPADRRATAFRRFWGRTDDGDDIDDLSTWSLDSTAGSHVRGGASLVLLVRGELIRRYPSLTIATVPASWNANESRSPVADAAGLRRPAFRGRIGEDVLYAGFAGMTAEAVVGSPVKADNQPGRFFLLAENPGDPHFGLDPDGGTTPPARATLSWTQLTLAADAAYASLPGFPDRHRCQLQSGVRDGGHDGEPRPAASLPGLHPRVTARATPKLMPVDPIRLQPFFERVTSASATHDTALRAQAVATRALALDPASPQLRARVRAATDAVAHARTAIEQARRTLDRERLRDLDGVLTSSDLLGAIPGSQVLGLFPVTLEARLDPGRLRVRVWPDAIATATHDPRLTAHEHDAATHYWRGEAAATSDAESRIAWRALADAIGVTRAAWAADQLTPSNRAVLGPGVEPQFPDVALQDDDAPFVPRASVLPDRWIVIGIRQGTKVLEQVGAAIPYDLAIGLDTTPSETQGLTNQEGSPIQLPPRMRWLTDFAEAVKVGMALDLALAPDVEGFDELFVVGVRLTETPQHSAATTLADLFTGHRFSRGLAFVPQNTPTNNSDTGGAGLPSSSERVEYAFDLERRPRVFPPLAANGVVTARALGMAPEVFASLPGSGAVAAVAEEPVGFEPELAAAMLSVLWPTNVGAFAEDFLGLSAAQANTLRMFAIESVRASGPIPAIRVGRQPYGVLPVTGLSDFVAAASEGIDPTVVRLLRATRTWFAMRRQPPVFIGDTDDALRQLGRSVALYAETTPQLAAQPEPNRFERLATTLQIATRRQIDDTWRTGPIVAVGDREPQPVAAPVVDAATRGELAALAAAGPQALLARPVPSSLLARMARHAALLEWNRVARAAVEASLDIASRRTLLVQARTSGSDVYLQVMVRAFSSLPLDPDGGPRPRPQPGPDADSRPHPFPGGDPEISAEEQARIRALVGVLDAPRARLPGADRLTAFRAALARLAEFPEALLESECFGVLDVCNHRVDAWFTALATQRLATLRAVSPAGLVIGGWGCLQDVRRHDPGDPRQRAEFIHAPTLDQAAAAAVLRSAAVRAGDANSHHADVDLSSRRVRLARWILEGVRNGRSLGELLGVRFERAIQGTAGEAHLATLREQFAPRAGFGVLDGLKLHQAGAGAVTDPAVLVAAEGMADTLDAVADALTAEAVYQIVKGNPESALATLERIAKGEEPPVLTVTQSPTPGIRLTHRVAVVLAADAAAPGWPGAATPRAKAEPLLDAWCGLMLGPASAIALVVEHGAGTSAVPLPALKIAAIDVVMAGRGEASELSERVVRAAQADQAGLVEPRVRTDRAWRDLIGLCGAVAEVITHARPLGADAFEEPSALPAAQDEAAGDLPQRVTEADTTLAALRDVVAAGDDAAGVALHAAAFGIRVPDLALSGDISADHRAALRAAIEGRLLAASSGTPGDRLRALFGGDLPGVVTFTPRDPATLSTATDPPPPSLFGNEPAAPAAWLDAAGRTHAPVARLTEVFLRREAQGRPLEPLPVAQAPFAAGDRWIATSFTGTGGRAPVGRLSVVMHAPLGLAPAAPLGGLLIDAWTETVPTDTRDTAMALRFNNASTRAPQVVLLGVSPDPSRPWTVDTLVAVLRDTMAFTRLRMQPSTLLSQAGHTPLVLLGQRPGASKMSFSVEG